MKFNKQISRFLSAITIGLCEASSLNSCVLGMEITNQFDQQAAENISKEFLKYTKSLDDYRLFNVIYINLSCLFCNPEYYKFHIPNFTTLHDVLKNIKQWMLNDNNISLFKDAYGIKFKQDVYKREIKFLNPERFKSFISDHLKMNKHKTDRSTNYINFFFDQFLNNISEKDLATDESMHELFDLLNKVDDKVRCKWSIISNLGELIRESNKEIKKIDEEIKKLEKNPKTKENLKALQALRKKQRDSMFNQQSLRNSVKYLVNEDLCVLCKKNVVEKGTTMNCKEGHIAHQECYREYYKKIF